MTEHNVARITALFQECRERLERFLRSRLRGSAEQAAEDAKDLAQESYMRLIQLKRRDVGNWEALLWVTAKNLANNQIERHQFRRQANARLQVDAETEDRPTPEKSFAERQRRAAVQRAINKLPERQRIVLTLIGKGKNYEQIAQELGCNERTCRRDVEEAILEIRSKIGLGQLT